jgi:hypothetical protein
MAVIRLANICALGVLAGVVLGLFFEVVVLRREAAARGGEGAAAGALDFEVALFALAGFALVDDVFVVGMAAAGSR